MPSDLQHVFNQLLAGKVLKIPFVDKRRFESVRVSLLRKFRAYNSMVESIGADSPFADKFVRAQWNSKEVVGIFSIADKTQRANLPDQSYEVVEL